MHYHILVFGIARDIVGAESLIWPADEPLTVAALRAQLLAQYPRFATLRSLHIAVNATYADDEQGLRETDEIALIPPVSGG